MTHKNPWANPKSRTAMLRGIRMAARKRRMDRRRCARCGKDHDRRSKGRLASYCWDCQSAYHRAYMQEYRKTHPLEGEARINDIARSYAGVYKQRGWLIPQPCGSTEVEMHHENYAKPADVLWLCRSCHLAQHRKSEPPPPMFRVKQ